MEDMKELGELGLNDNEIKVYLSCLALGSSKVHEIAKRSNLIRTTTYGILRSLIERGLISHFLKDNVTYFSAARPRQLVEILDEKKKKISSIIPKLEKIQNINPIKQKVESFEGKEGLKAIFNEFVSKPNQTVKIIGFYNKWLDFFGTWTDIYFRKKKEQNIKTFVITGESERKFAEDKRVINSKVRFLDNLDIEGECFIYQDKIAFVSFEPDNLKGVIIKDTKINDLQNQLFDRLWKIAKK